jgi:hypothetical protein
VILVHLLLVVAWACWLASLRLAALVPTDTGYAMHGWDCLQRAIMNPELFPLFGVANFIFIATPFFARRFHRRCPGWFAALACAWMALSVAAILYATIPESVAIATREHGVVMRIGAWAWAFSFCLAGSWLALCWLAGRKHR